MRETLPLRNMVNLKDNEKQREGGNWCPLGVRQVGSDGCNGNCGNLKDEEFDLIRERMIFKRRAQPEKSYC